MAELSEFDKYDCEGLTYLRWSMFDSPDSLGSGKKFMEREPVLILDRVVAKTRMILNITLGYATPSYADKMRLISTDSHRVGKAVRIRVVGHKKRMKLVKALIEEGVTRIAIDREQVYYDTDDLKESALYLWT
jgi:hypothetical protein